MTDSTGQGAGSQAPGLAGGVVAGARVAGYRLEEQIGRGGMAVVFRAVDERLGRQAAVKVLSAGLAADEGFRQRFVRESRAAAAVDDPHIIPVYQAGEADGVLYIAMRYVPGGDVGSLVRRLGTLPEARTAAIVSAVASALDAAHGAGLVHRDVKPANMLLDSALGRLDHVYLSDFGLSKAWQGSTKLTSSGMFLGTLDYCAPEQIEGGAVDGRADQYSLACAAFELLAGEPPFRREQGVAVMYAQVSAPPPPLTARRPELAPAVDAVLGRALAKSPAERYPSCGEFAHALGQALGLPAYGGAGGGVPPPRRPSTMTSTPGQPTAGGSPAATAASGSGVATQGPPTPRPWAGPAPVTEHDSPARSSRRRILTAAVAATVLAAAGVTIAILSTRGSPPARHPGAAKGHSSSATHGAAAGGSAVPHPERFTVCTAPAVGCTSVVGIRFMKTEPGHFVFTGDGTGFLTNLHWADWGKPTAHAAGVMHVDDCIPSCANGKRTKYRATVTLTKLTRYHGKQGYADMLIAAPSSPFKPERFTTSLIPG